MTAPFRTPPAEDLRARMERAVEDLLAAADRLIQTLDALDAPAEDLEGAQEDAEPSLGSLNGDLDQRQWCRGGDQDLEEDLSDYEPQGDDEPCEEDYHRVDAADVVRGQAMARALLAGRRPSAAARPRARQGLSPPEISPWLIRQTW